MTLKELIEKHYRDFKIDFPDTLLRGLVEAWMKESYKAGYEAGVTDMEKAAQNDFR